MGTPSSMDSQGATDGFEIRRAAVDSGSQLLTNLNQAKMFVEAMLYKWNREKTGKQFWGIESWQDYQSME